MPNWEEIDDDSITLDELTEELFIFMVYMKEEDVKTFEKLCIKNVSNITEVNVGDCIKYENPVTKIRK